MRKMVDWEEPSKKHFFREVQMASCRRQLALNRSRIWTSTSLATLEPDVMSPDERVRKCRRLGFLASETTVPTMPGTTALRLSSPVLQTMEMKQCDWCRKRNYLLLVCPDCERRLTKMFRRRKFKTEQSYWSCTKEWLGPVCGTWSFRIH